MAAHWSLLPMDLLTVIAMKLESLEDFVYFSAVCRCWNHASSSIKHQWRATPLPWLLLAENTKENPDCIRKVFNLNNNKCYKLKVPQTFGTRCWGSPYGWVAMVGRDLNVQLFNPITKAQIHFPSLETLPNPPEYFDKFDDGEDYYHWYLRAFLKKLVVLKVSQGDHYEFVIMVLYDFYDRLAFAKHGDQSWTSILIKETRMLLVDLVDMDDYVFALYDDGAIVYWNVKEFHGVELVKPKDFSSGKREIFEVLNKGLRTIYLVESDTDLLMVLRYKEEVFNSDKSDYNFDIVYQTIVFKVYKLNPKDKSWEEIEDLGNVALFVGGNYSMSVCVALAKNVRPNCIYFTDDEYDFWELPTELGGHDMGVYDIKCKQICRFYEGDHTRSSFCPPIWLIPNFN